MPTQVLTQLRALRESIADALRKDPRYLTLTALDKTIAEIDGVLRQSGVATSSVQSSEPLQFDAAPPSVAPDAPKPDTPKLDATAQRASPGLAEPAGAPAQIADAIGTGLARHAERAADDQKEEEPAAVAAAPEAHDPLQIVEAPVAAAAHSPEDGTPPASIEAPMPAAASASDADAVVPQPAAPQISRPEVFVPQAAPAASDATAPAHGHSADGLASRDPSVDAAALHDDLGAANAEDASNFHVTDEDESVALALQATLTDTELHEHGLPDAESHDVDAHDTDTPPVETVRSAAADEPNVHEAAHAQAPVGYLPMQPKIGAAIYQPAMSVKFGKLPTRVDLRPLMPPVEDHGDTQASVAQAVAGAYEYWIKKASKQDHPVSRTFLYYNARWRADQIERDDGCAIQFALEGLMRFGACAETIWPEAPDLVFARPGGDAYRDASSYRIHDMAHVPLRIDAWKQALAEGKPIVFGCATFDAFDRCAEHGGVVPMPSPETVAQDTPRLRSLCAVGYSDSERVIIVRNSEGTGFGDRGYCYMPFDYLMSEVLNDGDCWVFIPKVPSQPPREVWSDETSPVTNGGVGVNFPIEAHEPAAYAAIGRDLFEGARTPYRAEAPSDFMQYVGLAGRGAWDEMQPNDADLALAAATLEGGMAALAAAFPSAAATPSGAFDAHGVPAAKRQA